MAITREARAEKAEAIKNINSSELTVESLTAMEKIKARYTENETYMSCVFGHHIKQCECAALTETTCMKGEECPFYKSREEYYRDPYSGYVMKRDEYAAKKQENPRFRMMTRAY